MLAKGGARFSGDPAVQLSAAVAARQALFLDSRHAPWILAISHASDGSLVFAAQPLTVGLPGVIVAYQGIATTPGSIGGAGYAAGTDLPAAVVNSSDAVVLTSGTSIAVVRAPLSDGFALLATSPLVDTTSTGGTLLFIGVLLAAIALIIAAVRSDLQRPLVRLDRAVSALTEDDFETPVPLRNSDDEIARLSSTFERMRGQLHETLIQSRARVAIAGELNTQQPLQKALKNVCFQLRDASGSQTTLLCVADSEMADLFTVSTRSITEIDVEMLLSPEHVLGKLFSEDRGYTVDLDIDEPSLGGELSAVASPIRLGKRSLGVLVNLYPRGVQTSAGVHNLLGATAEQIAVALERYRFIAMVQQQASIDDLTGLHNHRFMVDHMAQQVAIAERLNSPLALLMLDIDHFKRLNDAHGHPAGDAALMAFARTLESNIRKADLTARYGGEEFVVVMPSTGLEDAANVADEIRKAVEQTVVEVDSLGTTVQFTVSIGVAAFPQNTNNPQYLLRLADEAVYEAKHGGRNRVVSSTAMPAKGERPPRHVREVLRK